MFLIRQATLKDFPGVFRLAQLLDSYNLPADRKYIRQLLKISKDSFQGHLPKDQAQYLFVIEKKGTGTFFETSGRAVKKEPVPRIVGCSLIIAQHGTPRRPHLWLSLGRLTKRSSTLRLSRSHQILRLGFTRDGPTEVGGLVVLPEYRGHPLSCGRQISYVRFLYMAMHPERFRSRVLVEYRGAMGKKGKSPFWEAIGRVFTGLKYHRADHLSVFNKEFILNLFPREPIYCALLPEEVQKAIGAIHPAAQRAARLLQRIGFRPIPQVEPFDGGPYYAASFRKIRIVRQCQRLKIGDFLRPGIPLKEAQGSLYLAGTEEGGPFRAIFTRGKVAGGTFQMERQAQRGMGLQRGDRVYACVLSR